MTRIKEGGSEEDALAVLSWVYHARRPLTMDELREALSVDPGQKSFHTSHLPIAQKLIEICEGLVICLPNGIVQFAHVTIQDFLRLHCQSQLLSNADIATTCLTYYGFKDFDAADFRTGRDIWNEYKLMSYVSEYWADHTRGVERDPDIQKIFFSLLDPKESRARDPGARIR